MTEHRSRSHHRSSRHRRRPSHPPPPSPEEEDFKCCNIQEQLEIKREEKARRNKPQPWVIRKFSVGLTIALIAYCYYVYIGRFCVPMIVRSGGAMGGRTMGVVFLVIFLLIGFILWWSYAVVVFTPAGFARDYVKKTRPPAPLTYPPFEYTGPDESEQPGEQQSDALSSSTMPEFDTRPQPESYPPPVPEKPRPPPVPAKSHTEHTSRSRRPSHSRRSSSRHERRPEHDRPRDVSRQNSNAGPFDAIPGAALAGIEAPAPRNTRRDDWQPPPPPNAAPPNANMAQHRHHYYPKPEDQPRTQYFRRPPEYPMLAPEFQYCRRDGFVKPMRAHHCRTCATCVLQYDHHCPWIGQCVGAFNRKFFVIFTQWACIFSIWTFSTLLARNIISQSATVSIDPQEVVVIALAGFYMVFTGALLASHIRLLLVNQTTVESMQIRSMQQRDKDMLGAMFGFGHISEKRAAKAAWDREWGHLRTEGHIWWLGSSRANWEATMGTNKWGWFFPIGKTPGDGLTYPINPRFDSQGTWRRRSEWPVELQ